MIELVGGDILRQDAEALVNTVNCAGVMGRGIALQFRDAFPENYREYRAACARHNVQPGEMFVHETGSLTNPKFIINFPTKRHWKGKSRLDDIEAGLEDLVRVLHRHHIRSVAIPPLGCGLGGLDWAQVRPLIESALGSLPEVHVYLFAPGQAPVADEMTHCAETPKLTVGRAALLALMGRYLGGLMDVSVSLLEIHKLMYFLQEAGEPLRLSYQKAPYGPYAENLRHVLHLLDGHYINGYGDGSDNPEKQIEPIGDATQSGEAFLNEHHDTWDRFDRVCRLIEGFETPFGMELLATVHWVAVHEGAADADAAVAGTRAWNTRKKMFTPAQIRVAWEALERGGWLGSLAV